MFRKFWARANRKLFSIARLFGVDIHTFISGCSSFPYFLRDLHEFGKKSKGSFGKILLNPCFKDRLEQSGVAQGHYFHQDLYVAQKIFNLCPERHVDIGSRIDGFVAHVASFRQVEVMDVRTPPKPVEGISFLKLDLTQPLPSKFEEYCDSLSCLHALEHFGLGRYGDPINPEGHVVGLSNLKTILKKNGNLFLSVPIGPQRVEFNAHRVFDIVTILRCTEGDFYLAEFAYVDDNGDLHRNVVIDKSSIDSNFGCYYGCGIFHFVKTR